MVTLHFKSYLAISLFFLEKKTGFVRVAGDGSLRIVKDTKLPPSYCLVLLDRNGLKSWSVSKR